MVLSMSLATSSRSLVLRLPLRDSFQTFPKVDNVLVSQEGHLSSVWDMHRETGGKKKTKNKKQKTKERRRRRRLRHGTAMADDEEAFPRGGEISGTKDSRKKGSKSRGQVRLEELTGNARARVRV